MAMYALLPICCFSATYTVLAPTRSAPRFAYDAVMRMQDVRHAPVALAASKSVDSPAPSGSTRRSDRSVRFAPSRAILVVCVCLFFCRPWPRRAVRHVGIRKFMPSQTFALSCALCRCRLMAHRVSHCSLDLSGLVCSTLEQKGHLRCLRDVVDACGTADALICL
jgi:hypothetical protein